LYIASRLIPASRAISVIPRARAASPRGRCDQCGSPSSKAASTYSLTSSAVFRCSVGSQGSVSRADSVFLRQLFGARCHGPACSFVGTPAARSSALQSARIAAAAITAQPRRIWFVDGILAFAPNRGGGKLSSRALIPHAGFETRLAGLEIVAPARRLWRRGGAADPPPSRPVTGAVALPLFFL
jgi:hypothetical protein